MRATIEQSPYGDKKLCVFLAEGQQPIGRIVGILYYDDDIDTIDISEIWFERDSDKQVEFQKDFLRKLRNYSKAFTIPKSCVKIKAQIDAWAKELGYEKTELPAKKNFDPNIFVWSWRFC